MRGNLGEDTWEQRIKYKQLTQGFKVQTEMFDCEAWSVTIGHFRL